MNRDKKSQLMRKLSIRAITAVGSIMMMGATANRAEAAMSAADLTAMQNFVYDMGANPIQPLGSSVDKAWQTVATGPTSGWYASPAIGYFYIGTVSNPMFPYVFTDILGMGYVYDDAVNADWARISAFKTAHPNQPPLTPVLSMYLFGVRNVLASNDTKSGAMASIDSHFDVLNKNFVLALLLQTVGWQEQTLAPTVSGGTRSSLTNQSVSINGVLP